MPEFIAELPLLRGSGDKIVWHVEEIHWFEHDPQRPHDSGWAPIQ